MTGLQAVSRQMLHSKNCTASTFSSLDWLDPTMVLQHVNGAADRSQAEPRRPSPQIGRRNAGRHV